MGIDTKQLSVGKLLNSVNEVFRIPMYQRSYDWNEEQWNALWEDLMQIQGNETHFLGTIITISAERQRGLIYHEVVDGQQRITTLLIILIAIRDFTQIFDTERAAYIDKYFLRSSTMDETKSKLLSGKKESKVFGRLIDSKPIFEEYRHSQVVKAYNFFFKKLKEGPLDWQIIYQRLVDSFDTVLMVTDSYHSAFRLFETLNNRGLVLSSVDLIKNYLLSKINLNERLVAECIDLWDSIIENLDEIDTVRQNKVRFFRHYLFSREAGVVPIPKLYTRYQRLIDNHENDLAAVLDDIWVKSELYVKIYNSGFGIKEIDEYLSKIVKIEATTSYPLLLKTFSANVDKQQIVKILKAIEIFTLRRSICNISTKDVDHIYNHLAVEAFKSKNPGNYIVKYLSQKTPTDIEFVNSFRTKDFYRNNQTKYILEMIEESLTNNTREKTINSRTDVHIEHIMPREIERTRTRDMYGSWQDYLGEAATDYKNYVNKIGNLTLLGSELNLKVSNHPFEEKKKNYRLSNIKITQNICQVPEWTFQTIQQRGLGFAKIAKEIWNFNHI